MAFDSHVNREQRRKNTRNSGKQAQASPDRNQSLPPNALFDALSLHKSGQLEQAKAIYEQILRSQPENPQVLNYLGVLKGQLGDAKGAIRLLTTAVRIEPKNVGYLNNLGNSYRAGNQLDKGIDCYQQALQIDGNSADSYFNLGIALTEKGMVTEAIAAFEGALNLNPRYARASLALGDLLQAQGNLAEAIACYRQALSMQPLWFEALTSLGMALYRQGDLKASQIAYEQALSINPRSVDALSNIGAVFYEQGRIDVAMACYREVVNLAPNSADAYINLGWLLSQEGQDQEAIDCYNQALKGDKARQRRKQKREGDRSSLKAMAGLAEVLIKQSQWDEAIKLYQRILQLDSNSADTLASLGIVLRQTGNIQGAIASFQQAIEINPKHIKAYAHLGLALQEQADINAASSIFDYQRLVAKYPLVKAAGWESLKSYNADLKNYIYNHPTLLPQRPGKPLHNGSQTYEIFESNVPVIGALAEMINPHIRDYFNQCAAHSDNPFFQEPPSSWTLSGWAVVLTSGGFQSSHIHPESFCSGVYYIQIPDAVSNSKNGEGNLSFGDLFPRLSDTEKIANYTIKPEAGLLVLFPSYFWHSTRPFTGESDRLCISFNVIVA